VARVGRRGVRDGHRHLGRWRARGWNLGVGSRDRGHGTWDRGQGGEQRAMRPLAPVPLAPYPIPHAPYPIPHKSDYLSVGN
jgi:hypothetical protein